MKRGDVHSDQGNTVWDELKDSERIRKDLQRLYVLKEREKMNTKRFLRAVNRKKMARLRPLYYTAAAAVALLVITFSVVRYGETPTVEQPVAQEEERVIPEVHYNITLKLASGKQYLLEDFQRSFFESGGVNISTSPDGVLTYNDKNFSDTLSGHALYNELIVPRGRECEITLSDGTFIRLNSESRLRYPVTFKGMNTREVFMDGEAYMQVHHNPDCPFIVTSSRMIATVLGTSFNLKDYPDEPVYGLTLVEGMVKVDNRRGGMYRLTPGEEVHGDTSTNAYTKEEADVDGVLAWTHGLLYFNNRTLREIAKDLEKRYDITVKFDTEQTADYSFMLKAQRFSRIEQILELLHLTKTVDYRVDGRTVIISKHANE